MSEQPKAINKNAIGIYISLLMVGGFAFCFITLPPLFASFSLRNWKPVTCQILSSKVEELGGGNKGSYIAAISYSYALDGTSGKQYRGNKYQAGYPIKGDSNGRAAVVAQHPVGSTKTCYVNPDNPAEAVLDRGFPAEVWIGLPFLLLMGVGIVGLLSLRRR